MLKPDHTTKNYFDYTIGSGLYSSRGCRGRELESIYNYYNLLLYNAAAISAALLLYALCITVGYSLLMLQESTEDASLR